MKKKQTKKSTFLNHRRAQLILVALVSLLVGCVGTYALTPTQAAGPRASLVQVAGSWSHCQVLSSGAKVCWSNAGDVLSFRATYKNSVKKPHATLTCWAVTNPPPTYPDSGPTGINIDQITQTTPVYTQSVDPVPGSGVPFTFNTAGSTTQWCWAYLFDGDTRIGGAGFGLGAPGQETVRN